MRDEMLQMNAESPQKDLRERTLEYAIRVVKLFVSKGVSSCY